MKILVVDDDMNRHHVFVKVFGVAGNTVYQTYNVEEALMFLNQFSPFDLVHLDHDLEDFVTGPYGERYEQTGQDIASYIVRILPKDLWPKRIVIHSWNPPGALAMLETIREAGIPVEYAPFSDGTQAAEKGRESCETEYEELRFGKGV